ncbi:mitochondrial ribosomal subunit domain-containing protein [Ditylenchus destructor]|uniref:Large ribosomal subunit protein mL51 n=1 Tax=Ditylenchus destructor TaxID=166010 RepID=A0AAD4NAC1_9BILA|nr:mitochondrial ribosomal subunit domain-containing protein [Ditylenchus destructor]
MNIVLSTNSSKLLQCHPACSAVLATFRHFHDRSQVPRVVDDREKRMFKNHDMGYFFRYHRKGIDPLPKISDKEEPLYQPKPKVRETWSETQARFGENDYIDILGEGKTKLHPAQLQYHIPKWLRGFPGHHKATEVVKLIHYRNTYKEKLERNSPYRWHQLCKRINHLLHYQNYRKSDELRDEREMGLWEEEPDYYYKDKSRRSYKDLP